MLFSIVNDPILTASELNHDLNVINQWAYQWKLEFNPDPNKQATELLFSCKGFNFSSSYREFELSGVRVIGIILYIG